MAAIIYIFCNISASSQLKNLYKYANHMFSGSRNPMVISKSVFPEPLFSGGQLTPSFKNRGSIKNFEGQLGLTPST